MDESRQVELLRGLLAQYSPTLQEAPAVQYLAEQMERLGFAVSVDAAGSLRGSLGSGPSGDGARELVLLGHIDTVPGAVPVRREGENLYGRGAVDAKGPLACFTAAVALCGPMEGWKITVIGATGEEGDSRGAKLVRDDYLAHPPAACIIGEPSGWDHVTLGYKGSAWLDYSVRRALAHTASQTESAAEAAVAFWNRVESARDAYNTGRPRAFEQLTTSLRQMGTAHDGFYATASLGFNLRLPEGLSVDQALSLLQDLAQDGSLALLDGIDCFRAEKNTPPVRAFLAAIRAEGGTPGFLVKTGTSDMNLVGPAWGCPILAYGPGDSSLDHTPDEHILIREYLAGVRVLAQALKTLTAYSGG